MDEIIDHKVDGNAVPKSEGLVRARNGAPTPRQTTKGWWLLARMKDHSTEWFKLKDLKESNPLEVAQCARDNQIEDEPAFIHHQEEGQDPSSNAEEIFPD